MHMELTFGENLRLLREERKLSQENLGKAINMTQRKVSYMENNKYEPSMEDIKSICQFFNISADYLLGFQKNLPFPRKRN